jgi:hypothetical protein
MAKRILILLGTFLIGGVLIGPGDLSSCGPFFPEVEFTSKLQPLDEARFFRGQLDILQPHYKHIYLMAAYRYLTGIGLSKADQQALLAPAQPDYAWNDEPPVVQEWLRARIQVGAPPLNPGHPSPINRFKTVPGYETILNCGDDAFRNAAATLVERGRAGASHDDLRVWVAAQDQVFSNCSELQPWQPPPRSEGPSIPAPLPPTAAPLMQADRAYQIAAAEFYAGEFDAASADFLRIAGDRSSVWHGIAPYLAARALIRKATIVDAAAVPAALEQLREVMADPDAAAWHENARGLARFLRVRTEPAPVLGDLARIVETQSSGVAGAMKDYRLVLDQYSNRNENAPRDEDVSDWLATVQYDPDNHALAKWRATRSLAWLVAALTYADQPDAELMAAAAQVTEDSPAFLTVEFHRLRLMPADEARPRLEAALRRKMPAPARNLFLAARLRLSRDWDELLRFAPRTVAGSFTVGLGEEPAKAGALDFDDDAARILDRQTPLAELGLAAKSSSLPANLRLQIARGVWVRAVLLNDTHAAVGIAPVLAELAPQLKRYLDDYVGAQDEKTRGFAAAWLMLNYPGMPYAIYAGAGRLTPSAKIDPFRANWWCHVDAGSRPMNAPLELLYQGDPPEPRFLTAAQSAETDLEQKRLAAAAAAPTWLARQAVEWVEAHPDDARAAESLHLAVRAGHYACSGDSQSDHWVKRAFQLLHSRYAKTEAARITPYWYSIKGGIGVSLWK